MRSKSIQNGDVGSQKGLRGPLQKSTEIWIDFWRLLGLEMDPGGVQLRYRETLASQKTAQNVKLCSNNGFEQNS